MDWMLERTDGQGMNGVSFGHDSYTMQTMSLSLLELLILVLETMASETTSLGFEVSWQKTKVQALGTKGHVPPTITVQDQQVTVVDEFVYLGSDPLINTKHP